MVIIIIFSTIKSLVIYLSVKITVNPREISKFYTNLRPASLNELTRIGSEDTNYNLPNQFLLIQNLCRVRTF